MGRASIPLLSQYLRSLTASHSDPSTDHELLQRFVARREEAAFAALVERHAAMVLGLCRSILRNPHDAEDIFQATFLVLARKAGKIRKGDSVGSWLYAVAYRLSHKERVRASKRRMCEQQTTMLPEQTPMDQVTWGELRDILHEEVSRLPEKYRAAIVLCYWEGRTHEQAGQELHCAKSTIKDRLEKARAMLRTRLARRGLALPAAWFAASLSEGTSAAVSEELVRTTARGAMIFSLGQLPAGVVSANAVACAKSALQAMLLSKLKHGLALLLILSVLGGGAGLAMLQSATAPETPSDRPKVTAPPQKPIDRQEDPLPAGAVKRLGTLRFRHGDWVRCIALGADGESIVSAAGKIVYVWDLASGNERRRFEGHDTEVNSVACSRDGKDIASLTTDGTIHLWDATTGREARRYPAHKPHTHSVWRSWQLPGYSGLAFTPDGKQLLSRGSDNKICLWDTATGAKKREFNMLALLFPQTSALGFTLSPDGKILAAFVGKIGAEAPHLILWDVATGRVLQEPAWKDCVWDAAFSPDSKTMAVFVGKQPGVRPYALELWDIASGKKLRTFSPPEDDWRLLGFSPDGKTLAVKGAPDALHFLDLQTGKTVGRLHLEHSTWITQLLYCRDGKTLVSCSHGENALRLWDRSSGKELCSPGEAVSSIRCVFSPDGRFLAIGAKNGVLCLWDMDANKEVWRTHQQHWLSGMLFSPDSRLIATNNTNTGVVPVRDVSNGKDVMQLNTGNLYLTSMAWSGDGKLLAACPIDVQGNEEIIGLWDPNTGKKVGRLSGGTSPINSLLFSPDSKTLLAARNGLTEGEVLRWRVNTGWRLPPFEGPVPGGLKCLAFSPDGRTVAAGATDRSIYLWEVISGRKRATLKVDEIVTSLAYSPDGKILVAARNSGYSYVGLTDDGILPELGKPRPSRIHLWDLAAEKELSPLEGHKGSITSLSFSPDGKRLATGSNDTTVLLWDATRFQTNRIAELQLQPEKLKALWTDLGGEDAVKAYRAVRTLAAAPKSCVAFFKQRLHPVEPADAKQLAPLLVDLDSEQFDKREKAMQQLEILGDRAATELHKALAGKPSLEIKRRIEQLLEKQNSGEHLRTVRALETLEKIATEEARALCAALAGGVADAPLTREARATLRRMDR